MSTFRICVCSLLCAIVIVGILMGAIILLPKSLAMAVGLLLWVGAAVAYELPFIRPSAEYLSAMVFVNILFWRPLLCAFVWMWRRAGPREMERAARGRPFRVEGAASAT